MKKILYLLLGVGFMAITGCGANGDAKFYSEPNGGFDQLKDAPEKGEEYAIMQTNFGDIKIRFFPEYAPKAVENFITHAKDGYYDGVIFHRVINEFMIQGGDPDGTGMGGESIWGEPFGIEVTPQLHHIRGALATAKTSAPISIGSQFFIVQNTAVSEKERVWLENKKSNPNSAYTDLNGKMQKADDGHYYTNKELFPAKFVEKYISDGGYPFLDFGYTVLGQVFEGLDIVDKIAASQTNASDRPLSDVVIKGFTFETY